VKTPHDKRRDPISNLTKIERALDQLEDKSFTPDDLARLEAIVKEAQKWLDLKKRFIFNDSQNFLGGTR
jgi:hypothetical protein